MAVVPIFSFIVFIFFAVTIGLGIWLLIWFFKTLNGIAESIIHIEKLLEQNKNNN